MSADRIESRLEGTSGEGTSSQGLAGKFVVSVTELYLAHFIAVSVLALGLRMTTFAPALDELFSWSPPGVSIWLKRLVAAALVAPPTALAMTGTSLSLFSVVRTVWPDRVTWRWFLPGRPRVAGAIIFAAPVWLAMAAIFSFAALED